MEKIETITKEKAINAAGAAMANYFVDLYREDKDFTMNYSELKRTALGMYSVACYFNEGLIPELTNRKEIVDILSEILDRSALVVGILHNLNPDEFCNKHFKGYKEFKESKDKGEGYGSKNFDA